MEYPLDFGKESRVSEKWHPQAEGDTTRTVRSNTWWELGPSLTELSRILVQL